MANNWINQTDTGTGSYGKDVTKYRKGDEYYWHNNLTGTTNTGKIQPNSDVLYGPAYDEKTNDSSSGRIIQPGGGGESGMWEQLLSMLLKQANLNYQHGIASENENYQGSKAGIGSTYYADLNRLSQRGWKDNLMSAMQNLHNNLITQEGNLKRGHAQNLTQLEAQRAGDIANAYASAIAARAQEMA